MQCRSALDDSGDRWSATTTEAAEQALKWVAHDPRVLATDAARIAEARDVDEAMRLAVGAALAAENLVVGDRGGRIAWTIYGADSAAGRLPRRRADLVGRRLAAVGRLPGVRRAPAGRRSARTAGCGRPTPAWSAARCCRRSATAATADGIRAWMIRERLQQLESPTSARCSTSSSTIRSLFLDRWRTVFLAALTPEADEGFAAAPGRAATGRRLVDRPDLGRFGGLPDRAQLPPDGVADGVRSRLLGRPRRLAARRSGATRLEAAAPDAFDLATDPPHRGPALAPGARAAGAPARPGVPDLGCAAAGGDRRHARPAHRNGGPLADRTWGEANAADIAHPLATAAPWLGRFLTMPRDPLPGDTYVPRVLTPRSGASERFVVSPGHEDDRHPADARAARAAIRCRRISATSSAPGSKACRCRCSPATPCIL